MQILNRELPSNEVLVCPIGDIQYGNTACSVSYLQRYLEWTRQTAEKLGVERAFIGTGDYVDLMSPSNRDRYKSSGLYSSTTRAIETRTTEPIIREAHELLAEHLTGRTVALVQGHHWMFMDRGMVGSNGVRYFHTDQWLAAELGAEFVEAAAIIKFKFPGGREYKLLVAHGEGNGSTPVYGVNKLSKQSKNWHDVDAFVAGHTHRVGIAAEVKLAEENGELVGVQIPLISAGSFLRSYLVDEVNYPEQKQLGGVPLGATALWLADKGAGPSGIEQAAMAFL